MADWERCAACEVWTVTSVACGVTVAEVMTCGTEDMPLRGHLLAARQGASNAFISTSMSCTLVTMPRCERMDNLNDSGSPRRISLARSACERSGYAERSKDSLL